MTTVRPSAAAPQIEREWVIAPPHPDRKSLASAAQIDELLAQLLLNRGIRSADAYRKFVACDFRELHPPEVLPGAEAAGKFLAAAARAGRKIVLYGDYDVDGITGTTILWHVLRLAGVVPQVVLPSRFEHGYGLHSSALESIAAGGGEIVVTIDCGITAVEPARRARELGLKLIITDHHQPGAELPDAHLIVHPTACPPAGPNPDLSGAGVALKVAWSLSRELSGGGKVGPEWRETLMDCTAFAALGLMADSVPMTGENRIITSYGLKHLNKSANNGIRALLDVAGLGRKAAYDDFDVGFALAPRLNAIGRLDHAREAVTLFTTATSDEAHAIAERLNQLNLERQQIERDTTAIALEMATARGFDKDNCRGIVLAGENWHPGVIGIVAARLVERFQRPTMLFSLKDGLGQGSGRSVRHFPLHEVLNDCAAHLVSFGGHAMAAGAKISAVQLDAFTEAFLDQAARRLTAADIVPKLHLDDEVHLHQVTPDNAATLARLAPHGVGNARPRLATTPVELAEAPRAVGSRGNHLQFRVRQGDVYRRAIAFGRGEFAQQLAEYRQLRLAFEPLMDSWQGRSTLSLKVIDWKSAEL